MKIEDIYDFRQELMKILDKYDAILVAGDYGVEVRIDVPNGSWYYENLELKG